MAKPIQPPANLDLSMPALDPKRSDYFNPMQAGEGTPWEDRGALGIIKAFFATAFLSLRNPSRLFLQMRRTQTTGDALTFALGCGVVLGASWVMHSWMWLWYRMQDASLVPYYDVYWYGCLTQFALAVAAIWPLTKLATFILHKLVIGETHAKFPPSLTFGVVCYGMGPAILTLVPVIGPPAAAVWSIVVMIIGSRVRLRLGTRGSVICVILAVLGAAVPAIILYFAGWLLWHLNYTTVENVDVTQPMKY